jgi:UDP-2,3-diacylglucosamine pyrophosphatase LpxH
MTNRDGVNLQVVVSDLHLADDRHFKTFDPENDFPSFLRYVRRRASECGGRAELIIAGDFIDFLRVEPIGKNSWKRATDKLVAVFEHNAKFFQELKEFAKEHRLTVLAGNHDVELGFLEVQMSFLKLFGEEDPDTARSKYFPDETLGSHFDGMGAGAFVYKSGNVYIEHGNQWDPLNRLAPGSIINGRPAQDFLPPCGSILVTDIVEGLEEERYEFISKVEPHWLAVPLLFLIDPKRAVNSIPALRKHGEHALWQQIEVFARKSQAELADGMRGSELSSEQALLAMLGPVARDLKELSRYGVPGVGGNGGRRGRLRDAYGRVVHFVARKLARPERSVKTPDRMARTALGLAHREALELVIFGHTHSAKHIQESGVIYINTGTWIDLYEIPSSVEKVFAEEGRFHDDFLTAFRLPSFAEIIHTQAGINAELKVWRDGGPGTL